MSAVLFEFGAAGSGLHFTVAIAVGTRGFATATVTSLEGRFDLNALWFSNGDADRRDGNITKTFVPPNLNMNGTSVVWDHVQVLSLAGLGRRGENKGTFISEGETVCFGIRLPAGLTAETLPDWTLGVRATSVNGGGGIKALGEYQPPPTLGYVGASVREDAATSGASGGTGIGLTYEVVGTPPDGFGLNRATGAWTFDADGYDALRANEALPVSVTIRATDGFGRSVQQTLTITVTGVNDTATITADPPDPDLDPDGFDEDDAAGLRGDVDVTDLDRGEAAFRTVEAGDLATAFGDFTFDAATGAWTFKPNAAAQALDDDEFGIATLNVESLDGTDTLGISLTVRGRNDAPVMEARLVTATGSEDGPVVEGRVSATDVDIEELTYRAVGALPDGVRVNPDGTWSYDPAGRHEGLDDGETVTVTFDITASDGTTEAPPGTVLITVRGRNDAPVMPAVADFETLAYPPGTSLPLGVTPHSDGTWS